MRIFISVDMEGATGVVHRDQLMPEGRTYNDARKLLTADVNAAIEGALRAAPEATFRVADGHGVMRNIVLEELHERAELVMGPATWENRPLCQVQGADDTFELAFMVGYHSRAGTRSGLLSHSLVGSTIANLRVNGQVVGETGLNATILGSMGMAVGLVTGADDLVAEAGADLPGEPVLVQVKRALGVNAAICLPPARTRTLIADGAEEAIRRSRAGRLQVWKVASPVTIEAEVYRREMRDKALLVPGVIDRGDRAFAATADNAADAASIIWRGIARAQDQPASWLQ